MDKTAVEKIIERIKNTENNEEAVNILIRFIHEVQKGELRIGSYHVGRQRQVKP